MKEKLISAKLPPSEYTRFSIIAVNKGKSRSALLKKLALDLIARDDARIEKEKNGGVAV